MKAFRDDLPIYLQLRQQIEEQVLMRVLKADEPVKSLRVLAQEYRINPITAANAINALVDEGILYQKRGIGVFVSPDARSKIISSRRSKFVEETLVPALNLAKGLEIPAGELISTIKKIYGEIQ
jgi:DNA-binding transcriptional regulator YhcF (GntR family)